MSIERVMNYIDAVNSLALNKYIMCSENGEIKWKDDATDLPTESEIQAEVIRLQAEYNAQEYARNRSTEYPSYATQLDEIFHNGIDSWKAVIQITKDKYPKPE